MGFYDDPAGIEQYISMAAGYDGRELITILNTYLPDESHVLELGMGPGVDLDLLAEYYRVTGSDRSEAFLARYRSLHPAADLLLLDAVDIDTDRRFDCIYSNKVLHHLESEDLAASFHRQSRVLRPNGLAFHSFWAGAGQQTIQGLQFFYYQPASLAKHIPPEMRVVASGVYAEMEADDSFWVLLTNAVAV